MVARPLTEEEYSVYAGSASLAIELVSSFRDTIALMRPFADFDSECVYVDRYSRICLSEAFFKRNRIQRATTVLHEAMHILNRHFERADAQRVPQSNEFLVAADFEIGTTLVDHPRTDTSHQIVPDRTPYDYPAHLTFEQYYKLLSDESKEASENEDSSGDSDDSNESQDSSGSDGEADNDQFTASNDDSSGGTPADKAAAASGCAPAGETEEEAADEANIERASDSETLIARQNTEARIQEERKKCLQAGNSSMDAFLGRVQLLMQPPKANWRTILSSTVNRASTNITRGRSDFTYRRPNRKLSYGDFIFPGMQTYQPTIAFGMDTSGSMAKEDYQASLIEAGSILKNSSAARNGIEFFAIDTKVSGKVTKVSKITDIKLHGGGGTDMAPAFTFLRKKSREKRPDIFVLATDGGVPWAPVIEELKKTRKLFRSIILITSSRGYAGVPQEIKNLAKVIDIS